MSGGIHIWLRLSKSSRLSGSTLTSQRECSAERLRDILLNRLGVGDKVSYFTIERTL